MKNISTHILKLISAYLSKDINEQEFNELKQWLNDDIQNKQLFIDHLRFYKISRQIKFAENLSKDKAWNHIISKIKKPLQQDIAISEKPTVKIKYLKPISSIIKYAAMAILFLGIGYVYQQKYFANEPELIITDENITLQLENGNIEIINDDGSSQVVDAQGNVVGTQNGTQLVYSNEVEKEALVYNTLTVPYGKRFEVQLSDGTHVNLNAGTSLKYPVKFIKGEDRRVFLDGEAYFNVAKDANHPFVVNADMVNVRVLGTQFNISSYPEDENINTVLVEGSVSVYKKEEAYHINTATNLKPGFKATWQKKENQITVEEADTEMYTAWIDGRVIFRRVTFENIIKKLERHYNVVIINNNQSLNNVEFGASFDIETIEQVFETLNANYDIDYTIENNQIIIN